jgi:hypothetical protein
MNEEKHWRGARIPDIASCLGFLVAVLCAGAGTLAPLSQPVAFRIICILTAIIVLFVVFIKGNASFTLWRRGQWLTKRLWARMCSHYHRNLFATIQCSGLRVGTPNSALLYGDNQPLLEFQSQNGVADQGILTCWWKASGANKTCFIALKVPEQITFKHLAILGALRRLQLGLVKPVIYLTASVDQRNKPEENSFVLMETEFRKLIDLYLCDGLYEIVEFAEVPIPQETLSSDARRKVVSMLCNSTLGDLKKSLQGQFAVTDETSLMSLFIPLLEVLTVYMTRENRGIVLCGPDLRPFWLWAFKGLDLSYDTAALCCISKLSAKLIAALNSAHSGAEIVRLLEGDISDYELGQVVFFLYMLAPDWATCGKCYIGDKHVSECFHALCDGSLQKSDEVLYRAFRQQVLNRAPEVFSAILQMAGISI